MKCRYCGKEIKEGLAFCTYCGKQQPKVKSCIKCGRELEADDMFCTHCGTKQDTNIGKTLEHTDKQQSLEENKVKQELTLNDVDNEQAKEKDIDIDENGSLINNTKNKSLRFSMIIITLCAILGLAFWLGSSIFSENNKRDIKKELEIRVNDLIENNGSLLTDADYLKKNKVRYFLTNDFQKSRNNVFNAIEKFKSLPINQSVRIEDIWTGAIWQDGNVKEKASVSIKDIKLFSDSTANVVISYCWTDSTSFNCEKTLVMIYDSEERQWYVDDLLFEQNSQKELDKRWVDDIQEKIDNYYKNWSFEWQHKIISPTQGTEINIFHKGAWERMYGTYFVVTSEDNEFYKTTEGFVKKGYDIFEYYESKFTIKGANSQFLKMILQTPDSAFVRIDKNDWLEGTFVTNGASLTVSCSKEDIMISGRFENKDVLVFDKSTLKEIGWNDNIVEAKNPDLPEPTKNIRSSSTVSHSSQSHQNSGGSHVLPCSYCGGSGKMAQKGGGMVLGYTNCPYCGGTGNKYLPH